MIPNELRDDAMSAMAVAVVVVGAILAFLLVGDPTGEVLAAIVGGVATAMLIRRGLFVALVWFHIVNRSAKITASKIPWSPRQL